MRAREAILLVYSGTVVSMCLEKGRKLVNVHVLSLMDGENNLFLFDCFSVHSAGPCIRSVIPRARHMVCILLGFILLRMRVA